MACILAAADAMPAAAQRYVVVAISVGFLAPVLASTSPLDIDSTTADATVPLPLPVEVVAVAHLWMAALLLLALALLALVYAQPAWAMDLVVRHSHASVLWCARTSARVCSLTIDDAPSPATPQILDLLRDHGVKATFFIISNHIQGNEEVVRRIVREGHRLGNHLTEDRASILDELHVFEQKLKECDAAIARFQLPPADASGPPLPVPPSSASAVDDDAASEASERTRLLDAADAPSSSTTTATAGKWLRPASGWFTSNMREIVMSHGYKICMGSVYPHDAQIKSKRLNALFLRMRTRPGAVLIVHDRAWTVGVLRDALPALVRKFKFVSLDELSALHQPHKVNGATSTG